MPPAETRTGDTRRDPRWLFALAALLLVARAGVAAWEHAHPPAPRDLVEWVPLERAEPISRATGKPVLYDFNAAWCGPCQAMRHDLFEDRHHARWLSENFVPVSVIDRVQEDGHNAPAVDSLQHAFGVTGFPTLVIWSPKTGEHLERSGYGMRDSTRNWLANGALATRMHGMIQLGR